VLDGIISHCNTVLTSTIYVGVACAETVYTNWHNIIFHCPCYVDRMLGWTELYRYCNIVCNIVILSVLTSTIYVGLACTGTVITLLKL